MERFTGSKLFSFDGRINRLTYWRIALPSVCVLSGSFALSVWLPGVISTVSTIPIVVSLWILWATQAKRWHDREKSERWVVLGLIPIIGLWAFIELGFLSGTPGVNRYGEPGGGRPFTRRLPSDVRPLDARSVSIEVYIPMLRDALTAAAGVIRGPRSTLPPSFHVMSPDFKLWFTELTTMRNRLVDIQNAIEEARPNQVDVLPLHWAAVAHTRSLSDALNVTMGMVDLSFSEDFIGLLQSTTFARELEYGMETMAIQFSNAYSELQQHNPDICKQLDLHPTTVRLLETKPFYFSTLRQAL